MLKLSIICITYNHAKFIKQALDGFLIQKTTFPFEVLIGDDCSTDGTSEIVAEYAKKYPNKIKHIKGKSNIGSLANFIKLCKMANTQYVAFCDGDDYWTDECKLQKQVDFLDAHPDYSLCFHPVEVKWEDKSQPDEIFPSKDLLKELGDMSFSSLLRCNFIQTNSVVYRWRFIKENFSIFPDYIQPGDWFLHLLHAQIGKIGFLPDIMGVYRKHQSGIWIHAGKSDLHYVNNGLLHLNFISKVRDLFDYYNEKSCLNFAKNTLLALLNHKEFEKLKQFSEQFSEFYSQAVQCISEQVNTCQKTELKKRHMQYKWQKLCGKIVKQHKTTYYFLYIPILRIKK